MQPAVLTSVRMCNVQPDHAGLYRSAQKEMRRWWARHGWPWLTLLLIAQVLHCTAFIFPFMGTWVPPWWPVMESPWLLLFILPYFAPLVLWLFGASAALRALRKPLDEVAAPGPAGYALLELRLALVQGAYPMVLSLLGLLAYIATASVAKVDWAIEVPLSLVPITTGLFLSTSLACGLALWAIACRIALGQSWWSFIASLLTGGLAVPICVLDMQALTDAAIRYADLSRRLSGFWHCVASGYATGGLGLLSASAIGYKAGPETSTARSLAALSAVVALSILLWLLQFVCVKWLLGLAERRSAQS